MSQWWGFEAAAVELTARHLCWTPHQLVSYSLVVIKRNMVLQPLHAGLTNEIGPALLMEHEVADAIRVSVSSVRRWRASSQGPPFVKLGRAVRYPAKDLAQWMAQQPAGGCVRSGEQLNYRAIQWARA